MKILVVFTGGTISCSADGEVLHTDKSNSFLLLDMYKRIDKCVEFATEMPYTILSENLCGKNLNALCECIRNYDTDGLDGIIVTHGTDTLQYTSAFLGYTFSNSRIPIVMVSANYPLADKRSNGFANFCTAVSFIKSCRGRGVYVAYKNKDKVPEIHRGTRVIAHTAYCDDVMSVFNLWCYRLENGIFVKNPCYREQADEISLENSVYDDKLVYKLMVYPDMPYPELDGNVKAVLFEGYHSGTLATDDERFVAFCKNADRMGIPLFLTGATEGFEYESKLAFDRLKINVLPPASPIAMYVKLRLIDEIGVYNMTKKCGEDLA